MKNFKGNYKVQKAFFGDVFKMYMSPLVAVLAFIGVFGEMFRQMFISLMMPSNEFQRLQDLKLEDESAEMSGNVPANEIEAELELEFGIEEEVGQK